MAAVGVQRSRAVGKTHTGHRNRTLGTKIWDTPLRYPIFFISVGLEPQVFTQRRGADITKRIPAFSPRPSKIRDFCHLLPQKEGSRRCIPLISLHFDGLGGILLSEQRCEPLLFSTNMISCCGHGSRQISKLIRHIHTVTCRGSSVFDTNSFCDQLLPFCSS